MGTLTKYRSQALQMSLAHAPQPCVAMLRTPARRYSPNPRYRSQYRFIIASPFASSMFRSGSNRAAGRKLLSF
jgi:hypothetical protein